MQLKQPTREELEKRVALLEVHIKNFLYALDRGYFGAPEAAGLVIGGEESAFISEMREAMK